MNGRFNLSEWSLRHPVLVLYALLALTLISAVSTTTSSANPDPPFTFKLMVVRTGWPGASAREVEQQVTDKLEKTAGSAVAGQSAQLFAARRIVDFRIGQGFDAAGGSAGYFYQVRKKFSTFAIPYPTASRGRPSTTNSATFTATSTPWSATVTIMPH